MTFLSVLLFSAVDARSSGLNQAPDIGWCSPHNPGVRLGCYANNWTSDPNLGTRSVCQDPSQNNGKMWWVGYPKASPNHTLRSGKDEIAADATSYQPNSMMAIYVFTNKARANFKGILLYATGGNNTKVGDWVLTQEQQAYAALAPTHLCNQSIMHIDANNKRYIEAFYFKTPPAGTGTINFHCLLKTGPPNPTLWGDFLWTNNLTLTEAPVQSSPWFVVPKGYNCSSACAEQGQVCDPDSLAQLNTQDKLWSQTTQLYPCEHGMDADTTNKPPEATTSTGRCMYHNESATTPVLCSSVASTATSYFCVCGTWNYIPPTQVPTGAPTPSTGGNRTNPKTSGAKPFRSTLSLALACAVGMFSSQSSRFNMAIVIGLILAAVPVSAHNWVEGPRGRAPFANTIQPTFPQMNPNNVQMQVGIGQEFTVEWAAAHTDNTYFVILNAANTSKLALHTATLLNDYLNNCDNAMNATMQARTPTGQKYNWAPANIDLSSTQGRDPTTTTVPSNAQLFTRVVPQGDPAYLPRRQPSPIFPAQVYNRTPSATNIGYLPSVNTPGGLNYVQLEYQASRIAYDAKCAYYNPKYPWIEAVHRYQHNNPGVVIDVSIASIPARDGPGRYMLHYLWSSYRDSIDVDVRASPVTNIYGVSVPPSQVPYDIGEHCMMEDATGFGSNCIEMVTNQEQCIAYCSMDSGCKGVQVIPLQGPEPYPASTQIPWGISTCNQSLWVRPHPNPTNTWVCYTVNSYRNNNNGAVAPWTFFDDPFDIGFLSTCYIKQAPKSFNYTVAPVTPPPAYLNRYRYGFSCIPCPQFGLSSTTDLNVPWNPSPCVACESQRSFPALVKAQGPKATARLPGFFSITTNCTSCYKWLHADGTPVALLDECSLLASQDPQCSSQIAYSNARGQDATSYRQAYTGFTPSRFNCACWVNNCCGTSMPTNTSMTTYTTTYNGGAAGFSIYTLG